MIRPLLFALAVAFVPLLLSGTDAGAQEAWVVRSFDTRYVIRTDGVVEVTEDILVDFQGLARHGILRYIPVEYRYDDRHNRELRLSDISVDDGESPVQFKTTREDTKLEVRIGDPDRTVTGEQRYRLHYLATGALNPFEGHDEFFWNVTGNDWDVPIERATATVEAPLQQVGCFQGPTGSPAPCRSTFAGGGATFNATGPLPPGSGLTIVAGLPKGVVEVPPPLLVRLKTPLEQARDFLGIAPLPIAAALLAGVGALGLVMRQWWLAGRDRWFGDVHYLTGNAEEVTKPPFARETIVTEYTPPEIGREKRRLRPAEIGLLIDEDADTLDVSATIVDLAVRGYLKINELPKEGLFGKADFRLDRLREADGALLPYEKELHESLFADSASVLMSELKNEFYDDLAKVKSALYDHGVVANKFFPHSPRTTRSIYLVIGGVVVAIGVGALIGLGVIGAGIVGLPLILAGIVMLILAGAMPRRTAAGREFYRRSLGFREYMVTAETDRQRFAEEANIFSDYLPYAIVFGCTDKWARAFEGLEDQGRVDSWYTGPGVFRPVAFASTVNSFSDSISSAIASTPGSSGSSGFSGGSSGGGMGGGGGSSW